LTVIKGFDKLYALTLSGMNLGKWGKYIWKITKETKC